MARTRIRWQNLGRLAAGVAVGAVALVAGAEALEPDPPEPLPPDVGLATGATGVHGHDAVAPAADGEQRRTTERPDPARPLRKLRPSQPPDHRHSDEDREQERKPEGQVGVARGSPAPVAPVTASPTPPPPAPSPPAPAAPPPAPPPSVPAEPEQPVVGDVKAEFGFEPRP